MDPQLDPPLRMAFLHPGRTLTTAEAHSNISHFLAERSSRMAATEAGSAAATATEEGAAGSRSSDVISAPLLRLNAALKQGVEREKESGRS